MRKVETSLGALDVRSLTRAEIRAGKDLGMRYLATGLDLENFEDYRDYALGCQFTDEEIDHMTNVEQNLVLTAILRETWGDEEEEKNSSGSGQNDQTQPNAKPVKVA